MRRTLRSGSTRAQDMAEVAGAAAVWRTLKIPDYRNYMAGNFVSQDGLWTPRVGVQWLTCELTESPTSRWAGGSPAFISCLRVVALLSVRC